MRKRLEKYDNLVGKVFGNLEILEYLKHELHEPRKLLCKCLLCGTVTSINMYNVVNGYVTSCGCKTTGRKPGSLGKNKDILGKTFGNLIVTSNEGVYATPMDRVAGNYSFKCRCNVCGKEKLVKAKVLREYLPQSCGCLGSKGISLYTIDAALHKSIVNDPELAAILNSVNSTEPIQETEEQEQEYPDFEAELDGAEIINTVIGDLTINDEISGLNNDGEIQIIAEATCSCGRKVYAKRSDIMSGAVTSCQVCEYKSTTAKSTTISKVVKIVSSSNENMQ